MFAKGPWPSQVRAPLEKAKLINPRSYVEVERNLYIVKILEFKSLRAHHSDFKYSTLYLLL